MSGTLAGWTECGRSVEYASGRGPPPSRSGAAGDKRDVAADSSDYSGNEAFGVAVTAYDEWCGAVGEPSY